MSFDKKKGVLLGVVSELVYLCGCNLSQGLFPESADKYY